MKAKLLLKLVLLAALAGGCAVQPEQRLLATWYITDDGKDPPASHRTLYLGLLNAGEKPIAVAGIVINDFVKESTLQNAYTIENKKSLQAGEIAFVRLGDLDKGDWECRLPVSVIVFEKVGDSRAIKAESVNLMPTSIPDSWRTKKCAEYVLRGGRNANPASAAEPP